MIHIVIYAALITLVVILAIQSVKWYISTIALMNWAARSGLTPPTLDELNRSVGIVVRDIIKKFFKRR